MASTRLALVCCSLVVLSSGLVVWSERAAREGLLTRLGELDQELRAQRGQCREPGGARPEGLRIDSETAAALSASIAQVVLARLEAGRPVSTVQQATAAAAAHEERAPATPEVRPEQADELRRAAALVDDAYTVHSVRPEAIAELRTLAGTVGNTEEYRAQLQRLVVGYNRGQLTPPQRGPALP